MTSTTWLVQSTAVALVGFGSVLLAGCDGSGDSDSSQIEVQQLPQAQGLDSQPYHFRVGDTVLIDLADGAPGQRALNYSITPNLPDGLVLDTQTGQITGVAQALNAATAYSVRVANEVGSDPLEKSILLALHAKLPEPVEFLDSRYSAEIVLSDAAAPVRMALSDDGQLFYAELLTGNIRLIDPSGGLVSEPFATLAVESGQEKGLLGLALDPEFATNGYVYAYATVPGHDGAEPHAEIVRFTSVQNSAVDETVLVDYLPMADIHNGGDLVFDKSGHLFVGRGDSDDASSAQQDDNLSGRVLRYTRDGAIPADNPYPGSPEWSRGLRNTFALAVQPQTGDLFGADAGPASDDKLNFLRPGKNFVWGMESEPQGSGIGFTIKVWAEVITPTALFFHSGSGVASFKNQLFLSSYNEEDIRRVDLAGDRFTDYIREIEFAAFSTDGSNNKPLHMLEGADGSVYVSTFNAIYRFYLH